MLTRAFSDVLLQLTVACHQLPVEEFRRHILDSVVKVFNASMGWWAMTYEHNGTVLIHSSCYTGIPDDCEEILNLTYGENLVRNRCHGSPGVAGWFGPEELYGNVATAALAGYMDIQQLIAIELWDTKLSQSTILSVARKDRENPFSSTDASAFELLAPHLVELLKINFSCHIARMRDADFSYSIGQAVADSGHMIHTADSVFLKLVAEEWPQWKGPKLPDAIITTMQNGQKQFAGSRISAEFSTCDRLWLITAKKRSVLDILDRREREIAVAFAAGDSYKQVAKQFGISPATVRHYLRRVYEKFGISNKATLVALVGRRDG